MRIIAAYLLAVLGGNENPSKDDITNILSSVGIEADKERLDQVITLLHGKNVYQLINEGYAKLASVAGPRAGGAVIASSATGGAGAAAPAAGSAGEKPKDDKEKDDKKKKKDDEEEVDEDMGGLFGGDGGDDEDY